VRETAGFLTGWGSGPSRSRCRFPASASRRWWQQRHGIRSSRALPRLYGTLLRCRRRVRGGGVRLFRLLFRSRVACSFVFCFFRRHSCLLFHATASTSSSVRIYGKVRFLQPSFLVVKVCKPALLGVYPEAMFFQCFLDLVVSSEWFLRSSKPCMTRTFAGVSFLCCLGGALFKLRRSTVNQGRKTAIESFNVFYFTEVILMSSCFFMYQLLFPYKYQTGGTLLNVFLFKKKVSQFVYRWANEQNTSTIRAKF